MNVIRVMSPVLVTSLCLLAGSSTSAQLPSTRLDGLFPAGGSPGQTVEVTISGADLDDVNRLQFSHPGITAKQKMAEATPFDETPQPVENQFIVTIAGNVPAGQYRVRCQGKYGLSGPRTFVVDQFGEVNEAEPNNEQDKATELEKLPHAVNGQLNGAADIDWYQFQGTANQRLLVECYAERIDSPADVLLQLLTADGRVLSENRRSRGSDPFLDVTLPANGVYLLRVQEALYRGGVHYTYRIVLGSFPAIDFIFPPAGLPGSNEEYTIYGRNLPSGQRSPFTLNGRPLEQRKVRIAIPGNAKGTLNYSERLAPFQAGLSGIEHRVTSPTGTSNPVLLTVAGSPLVREQADNNTPKTAQKLTPPCEVMGQFYPQRDADWYTFDAKSGDEYWIEAWSHRLGCLTDPALVIQRVEQTEAGEEKVTQLAWVDDFRKREGGHVFDDRHRDPAYKFTAPADGTYRILLREGHSSLVSDPRLVYRLSIRPANPDFQLAAVPTDSSGSLFFRQGGREAVRVVVFRQDGFQGEITVTATGLPAGVTASPLTIGPGSQSGLLVLTADANAGGKTGTIQIAGQSKVGTQNITRQARFGHPLAAVPFAQPNNVNQATVPARLTDSLPFVVSTTEKERVVLKLEDPKLVETSRGGRVKFKYSVVKENGAGGNLNTVLVGLPTGVTPTNVNLGGNASGEFQLNIQAATPPGTYSFCLAAMLQGMNYQRNPEAAEAAKKRAERIGKIYTDSQKKTQMAQQNVSKMQTQLNQANAEVSRMTTAKNTANQTVTTTAAALKSATTALENARKQLAAKATDTGLKQQFEAAQKAQTDAQQKAKAATDAAALALKNLQASQEKQKAATEAKTKADQELRDAQQFQTQAQQEKQRADQKSNQLAQLARQRGYNLIIPSTPVTIRIAEYPITLTKLPEKLTVKQGEKVEIPFHVERLYGFNQNVNTQILLPSGVGGLQIQNVNLNGSQKDGKSVITAQNTATPGEHTLRFRITMNFNGQNLTLEREVHLTVIKVEPAK